MEDCEIKKALLLEAVLVCEDRECPKNVEVDGKRVCGVTVPTGRLRPKTAYTPQKGPYDWAK